MKLTINCFMVISISLIGFFIGSVSSAAPLPTLENLQRANLVEANAYNRYMKFGDQAEKEGYPSVAKLFRSVAFSEILHSRNYGAAIEDLGGKPQKFELKAVKIGSTLENLQAAARDERKDELEMYSTYAGQASKDGLLRAKSAFVSASHAELQHKELFEKGLNVLGPKNVDYYIEVKDGDIVAQAPGLAAPKSKLIDGAYVKAAN